MGVRLQLRPAGVEEEAKDTVPVNPLTGAIVMVDDPVVPARIVTEVGETVMVKSGPKTL